jgi:hypothetical protein
MGRKQRGKRPPRSRQDDTRPVETAGWGPGRLGHRRARWGALFSGRCRGDQYVNSSLVEYCLPVAPARASRTLA